MSKPYEKPTMELRQMLRHAYLGEGLSLMHKHLFTQRKWIVADGEPIMGPSCSMNEMVNGVHPAWGVYLYGAGSYDALWQPVKEEWRDLPIVNEETK